MNHGLSTTSPSRRASSAKGTEAQANKRRRKQESTRTTTPQNAPEKRPTTNNSFTSPAPNVSRPASLSATYDANSDPAPSAHAPTMPAAPARNAESSEPKAAVHATSMHQIATAPKSAPWGMMRSRMSTMLVHAKIHDRPAQAREMQARSQTKSGHM